jgi:hypothetical protein
MFINSVESKRCAMAVCEILVKVSVGNYTVCGIAMNGDPLHEDLGTLRRSTGTGG